MSIPSPRKFIEITLLSFLTLIMMACMAFALLALAIFALIEAVLDRFSKERRA